MMTTYNFDEHINRKNTFSEKWDDQDGDFIPLWVADMDFRSPEPIIKAVAERLDHGIFGYTDQDWELLDVVVDFYKKTYEIAIEPEWIVWTPSVMPGANIACRICGGSILYNTPIYPHIRRLHDEANCNYYEIPLTQKEGVYSFNFDQMERSFTEDIKAFVLCNPHNPVGRIYSRAELEELLIFCEKHDLLIISDEIHSQLIFDGQHIPMFALNDRAKKRTITLTSAAKTYNIPSMPFAFSIIPDDTIRKRFQNASRGLFPAANSLTIKAIKAAYTECDEWRTALLNYLKINRGYTEKRVAELPGLTITHSEATYMAWIDASDLPVENPWMFFRDNAGVNFSNGADFGSPGFLRINFGCTLHTLERAFDRVEKAIKQL